MRSLTARLAAARRSVQAVDVWLALAVVVGVWARFSRVGEFDNQYYTATVASMLHSPHNFLFGSFDPGGAVMVDKPPGAFWVHAVFARFFGVSAWSVNLPQAIVGILAPIVLYVVIKRGFGRIAAVAAAAVLVVAPVSIVIDSRNEPDGLLSFALLLAAVCIIRAAQTGKRRWLLAFSLFVGLAFNIKMLVAFVPLPAFLLYYLLSARVPGRTLAIRTTVTIAVLLAISFSWATFVALTPADSRPYIGSTRDNSIWTLIFEYNGLNRFGAFIGARPAQPQQGAAGDLLLPPGAQQTPGPLQRVPPYQATGNQANGTPLGPPGINPDVADRGVLGLFVNPLAAQLGWLFPMAILMLVVAITALLSERLYRGPLELLRVFRGSSARGQTVLWVGWLVTAAVVFGVANATTTHPYYLVGMATPMAAVIGIGFGAVWQTFRRGSLLSWVAPAALLGGVVYQALLSQGLVGDLIVAVALVTALLACTVLASALWRRLAETSLAGVGMAIGGVALLAIPLVFGLHFGGRIAGAGPGASIGPQGPPQGLAGGPAGQRELVIEAFILQQGDAGARYDLGTVSAREAAPFIIAGFPAVAIGGFSGSDPIFTVASFKAMVARGDLRYFLMPGEAGGTGPPGRTQQDPILSYIRTTWQDVSYEAGLRQGSLFRRQSP
ncbi:MAG: phospholipid carrier-dependent glycosyltransferase [Dehalococcoidia bacterium]|nr:phospholipid carrier-dependent glycosyltransferase [Dehalococcoidia bacterium]